MTADEKSPSSLDELGDGAMDDISFLMTFLHGVDAEIERYEIYGRKHD